MQDTFFDIIWPGERTVPGKQIEVWYSDAVANGDIEEIKEPLTLFEKASALHEVGHIILKHY